MKFSLLETNEDYSPGCYLDLSSLASGQRGRDVDRERDREI